MFEGEGKVKSFLSWVMADCASASVLPDWEAWAIRISFVWEMM